MDGLGRPGHQSGSKREVVTLAGLNDPLNGLGDPILGGGPALDNGGISAGMYVGGLRRGGRRAPNGAQPEVSPVSKPGFWARFCPGHSRAGQ